MPKERPLVIASSGGGGHIAAAKNIMACHQLRNHEVDFPDHEPPKKTLELKVSQTLLYILMYLSNNPLLRVFNYIFQIPNLPTMDLVSQEISDIVKKNSSAKFIELMDAYDEKYEFIAIFNCQQKQGLTKDIKKSINMQWIMDWNHRDVVRVYFLEKLTAAYNDGNPYTSLINTQAQGIAGLCDAVIEYNAWLANEANHNQHLPIKIEQYITDLLTPGATHYTTPLNKLSDVQAKQVTVHYVNHSSDCRQWIKNRSIGLSGIAPKDNPMVCSSFKNKEITPIDDIQDNDKVMVISLGALGGGTAPSDYLQAILDNQNLSITIPNHICVFRCDDGRYDSELTRLANELKCKLHIMPKQSEDVVANYMKRADYLIIKPGGITTMNVMSMIQHDPAKTRQIIFHKPENKSWWIERKIDEVWYWLFGTAPEFQDGLSWENCNASGMANACNNTRATFKTSTTADICENLANVRDQSIDSTTSLLEVLGVNASASDSDSDSDSDTDISSPLLGKTSHRREKVDLPSCQLPIYANGVTPGASCN